MANIKLNHVQKIYPNGFVAVKDFNLYIEDKEFVVFVGPSGCGKSTTLRMIAGLEEITEGQFFIDDEMMNNVASKDRDIAMVFQNYALYPHMTVYDNIAFGLKLRKTPKKVIKRKVHEAADLLEIEHLLDKKPKVLSGGQRQRVAMGRAIVREPKIFLMDEPLSNLDAKLRVQMRTVLSKLHQKLQTTFIYVTHDQTEAMTLGTRIVVMKDGIIQQIDTPHNLYNKPNNLFVAGFIGSPPMNFIKAVAKEQGEALELRASDYSIKLNDSQSKFLMKNGYIDKAVIAGIRPENLSLCETPNNYDFNALEACIEISELLGAETLLHLRIGEDNVITSVNPHASYKPGGKVKLSINPDKIHVFDKDTENSIL